MKKPLEPRPPDSVSHLHDHPAAVPDLDLHAAPDLISRRSPLTLATVLRLLEERRQMFPLSRQAIPSERRRPVPEEFVV